MGLNLTCPLAREHGVRNEGSPSPSADRIASGATTHRHSQPAECTFPHTCCPSPAWEPQAWVPDDLRPIRMWTFCEPGSDHPHGWRQRSLTQVVFVVGHSKERCTHTGHHHTGMSVLTTCVYTLVQGCMHTPRVYTQAYV